MDLGIRGKVAIVLGASKGMGRACARALAEEGCVLALGSRTPKDLGDEAAAIVRELRVQVFHRPCDATRDADREAFLKDTVDRYGRVDILVNNCGGPKPGGFRDQPGPGDWQEAIERSLLQVVKWTYGAVPHMKGWGRIVNIVSTTVRQPHDALLLSNSVRPGVIGFSKTASRDLAPLGITINSVLPGLIRTDRAVELAERRAAKERIAVDQALREKAGEIPAGRLGEPGEVGALVAFLCSQQAAYVTGTSVVVDGGATRTVP
jgi:3-oxoacyl-[acyl-carrier protein] reductase